eukprot:2297375-Rhodomonas_salina.1
MLLTAALRTLRSRFLRRYASSLSILRRVAQPLVAAYPISVPGICYRARSPIAALTCVGVQQ